MSGEWLERQDGHGAIAEMLNYQHDNKWKSPR